MPTAVPRTMTLMLCAVVAAGSGAFAGADEPRPLPSEARAPQKAAAPAVRPPGKLPIKLIDGDDSVELELAPSVVLAVHTTPDLPPREVTLLPTWRADGPGRWKADLADEESGARATMRLANTSGAELTVEVRYTRRAWVSLSALDFTLPGRAQVIDRDLSMRAAGPLAYLDRFGAKAIRCGQVTAVVDDGVDGVVVRKASSAHGAHDGPRDRTDVRVELLSADARPFLHDARCREDWRQDNPKLSRAARLREPGDGDLAHVELRADVRGAPLLSKSRWPEGRDAALVITDHADQSSPDTFTAIARGRSDALQPVGGLLGHHLVITKSLFLRGAVNGGGRRQLEDQRVAAIADELARHGSEIIPHSVTPDPDDREATAAGLDLFDRFHGATWIDHQPETNCEAFTNQGWRGAGDKLAGRWGIADLLARHGYRYLWSAMDQDEFDLLWAGHLDRRALTVWPLGRLVPGDPDNRWLFKTNWMHWEQETFYRLLGPQRLDRLEREHGLVLLHTYLESLHTGGDNPRFAGHNVIRRAAGGVIETSPRLEKVFEDIEKRIAGGTLWMPTMSALGDWLQRMERVTVHQSGDGRSAQVTSPVDVRAFTLHVPGDVEVTVDGALPRGRRAEKSATLFWFDLKANRPVRVEVRPRQHLDASRGSAARPTLAAPAP